MAVLQPEAVTYVAIPSHGIVDQANFDAVNNGKLILWVWGRITYDDVFGGHHWTTFVQTFNPSTVSLNTYKTGNDVDRPNTN